MSQHTCLVCLADISLSSGVLPKALWQLVNLKVFDVSGNSIGGELYVPAYMCLCVFLTFHPFVFFAGELPKELGNLVNLTMLFLSGNQFRGTLCVPAYMRCMFADILLVLQANCPRSSATLSI